jgi:tRNA G10  N-methylase Trm11
MKTIFILGRNPKLSRQEVLSFLAARNRPHKEIFFENNLLILETNENEKFEIGEFGGILKIGTIQFEGDMTKFSNFLKNDELIESDKFSYATFGNLDPELIKKKFKSEKRKAILKHGRRRIKFQEGETLNLPKADYYLFFHKHDEIIYFGTIKQNYNSKEIEQRDMNKPVRREHLAISPRLAKILINLSGAKPGIFLLDPFCGVGGILQEALLKGIKCQGIDMDPKAINGAEKNLKWLKENYEIGVKYTLETLDSKKTPDLQFAAIATETPLGKILRKKPNDNEARQIIQNFESRIIPILTRLKKVKKPEAKIAITFPIIGKFKTDTRKIAQKTDLKIHIEPITESRPDQFISREIIVFT